MCARCVHDMHEIENYSLTAPQRWILQRLTIKFVYALVIGLRVGVDSPEPEGTLPLRYSHV